MFSRLLKAGRRAVDKSPVVVKVLGLGALLLVLLAVLWWAAPGGLGSEEVFYAGVMIAGEPVKGKSYAEVAAFFKERADVMNSQGIVVKVQRYSGGKEVKLPPFVSGLTSDKVVEYFSVDAWEETVKDAYGYGRQGPWFRQFGERLQALVLGRRFTFDPVVRKDALHSFLDNISQNLPRVAPARFVVADGKVAVADPVVGERLNREEIMAAVSRKVSLLDASPLYTASQQEYPTVEKKALEPFLGLAAYLAKGRALLQYDGYTWRVNGSELIGWLTPRDGALNIDQAFLQAYMDTHIAPYVEAPVRNSRFQVIGGEVVEISPGVAGNAVDTAKTLTALNEQIAGLSQNTEAPVIRVAVETSVQEPSITKAAIQNYRLQDLVGTAVTNFTGGSADRQHNIETGVAKMNGMLIAPGEEFSTVRAIGEITEEAGFVKEYVIKEGKTTKELGGGLCQLATTLFRTALDAGLPITERTNHRYVIPYYGAGLDATIYGPHPDFRFVNDTGSYLLLQGRAVNNEVTFELYGRKDGRIVEISKPVLYNWRPPPGPKYIPTSDLAPGQVRCTEIPHDGVTADVTYTVSYVNGVKKETEFHSVYSPWQKVCFAGI